MCHDNATQRVRQLPMPRMQHVEEYVLQQSQALVPQGRQRGRPARPTAVHLCLGIVLCGLQGFGSQLQLWLLLCLEPIGPFAPVAVVDQAVYNRLARAATAMRAFFEQVSGWMGEQLEGLEDRRLAPWASQVLALDESTLDAVGRWLPALRAALPGDPRLLAGRISALFDVRRQQWVRVGVWQEAVANCKQQARLLLSGLQAGTLLLFDRGYLSFPWFDELSERGLFWISRYANHASMQVRHILYQGDGVLDAIVWLGTHRADRAKHPVRLVQFYHHGRLHRYLTNVLDPQQLSLADLARLYARRWDIEIVQSQMTKTQVLAGRGGGDHVTDLHLLAGDDNAINQQLNQLAFLLKGGLSQALLDALAKRLHGLDQSSQLVVASHAGLELTDLFSNPLQTVL
jgi:hypothetical protein